MAPRTKKKAPEAEDARLNVVEIPPVSVSDMANLGAVKAALQELETGVFRSAADLVEQMWTDDRIPGVVETRIDALHGLELSFDPPEGEEENATAEEIAEAAERGWPSWLPEEAQADLRRWGLMLNMGLARIRWDTSGETWEPRVEVFHPRNVSWSALDQGYVVQTQQGHFTIRRDARGIVAKAPQGAEELNAWIVYTPYGWKRGWMRSLVRSLAILWLFRQWALRDWSAHSEAHGSPSKKAFVPNGTSKEDKRKFLRDVALLARRSAVLLERGTKSQLEERPGFDVELLEAAADSHKVFEGLKSAVDTDIAIRVKGTNLTTEVKGGSFAATTAHREVDESRLRFDAGTLGTCVRDQVIVPWAEFNFGARELAPWPRWDTEPPEDLKTAADALDKLGDAAGKLWKAGFPLDIGKLSERFNVPVQEGAKMPTEAPAPPPAAAAPAAPPEKGAAAALIARGPIALATLQAAAEEVPPGALIGQLYCDDLVAAGQESAVEVLRRDVGALLDIVRGAKDWDDLRAKLAPVYRDMDPAELQAVIRNRLILAELNGQLSVREDR